MMRIQSVCARTFVLIAAAATSLQAFPDSSTPLRVDYSATAAVAVDDSNAVAEIARILVALAAQGARVRLCDAKVSGGLVTTNDVDVIAGCFRDAKLPEGFKFVRQPLGRMSVDLFVPRSKAKNLGWDTPSGWPELKVAFVGGALSIEEKLRFWATEHNAKLDLVGYPNAEAGESAVLAGEVDALAVQSHKCRLAKIAHLGDFPFYIAVSAARDDEYRKLDAEAERLAVYEHAQVDGIKERILGVPHPRNFIRVAYFNEPGLMMPDDKMRYDGMAAEFLDKLCAAGGFSCHPVHCSYADALRYVSEGGVELVAGVSYGGVRNGSVLLSRMPMGLSRHFLFVHRDSRFASSESGGWNGMSIALGPSVEANRRLDAFLEANGCICRYRHYANTSDAMSAYFRNETDAVFAVGSRQMFGEKQLASFPAEPLYIGVSPSRPDLVNAVDKAMSSILADEPDYSDRITRRHLPVEITLSARLTYEERKWVDHLRRNDVKIPVDITPLLEPIKAWKNGAPVGFVKALFDLISRESGLEFSFLEPTTSKEAKERMIRGDSMIWADMAAVVDVLPKEYPRISHVRIPPVYTRRISAPDFNPMQSRLAILDGDNARRAEYVRIGFDETKFVPFPTIVDCFRAVREGKADCVLTSYSTAKLDIRKIDAEAELEIRSLNLWGFGPEFALVLNPSADPKLVTVISKCLEGLSGNQLDAMSQRALADAFEHSGLTREQRAALSGVALLLIMAMVTVFVLVWLMKRLHHASVLAESASRAKTTFLFSMSHDIRTPMNAIMGYTAMAKARAGEPTVVADCISKIEVAGKHLLSLINQILEMSRIESGKVVLEMVEVDLVERTQAMTTIAEAAALQKGLYLEVCVGDLEHPRVLTDSDRAAQIIQNILGNAVKYTPSGGKITYTLEERPCNKVGYSNYVVKVSDTGIGMSEEFIAEVFKPFSRERSSTVSKIEGTGLGMSIVKRIVDIMGGTINIESTQGVGTTVTVSVPMKWADIVQPPAGKVAATTKKYAPISLKGRKMMLVEDNEMNREVAHWMLEEQGLEVVEAVNGKDAVEKFEKIGKDIDFMLMDIQMPVLDGYGATKAIREFEAANPTFRSRPIPIVALSANAFEEDRQRSLAAGMNAHVAKPIKAAELFEALSSLL